MHHVTEGCEDAETDKFDGGMRDIVDRDSEWTGTNMSSEDYGTISTSDRDLSMKLRRLDEIFDVVGAIERGAGIDGPGSGSEGMFLRFYCSSERVVVLVLQITLLIESKSR